MAQCTSQEIFEIIFFKIKTFNIQLDRYMNNSNLLPIQAAVAYGDIERVERMLPLHSILLDVTQGQYDLLFETLEHYADLLVGDELHKQAPMKQLLALWERDGDGNTPLNNAAKPECEFKEFQEILHTYIQYNISLDTPNKSFISPVWRTIIGGDIQKTCALFGAGATLPYHLIGDQSPIQFAVSYGDHFMVELLHEQGADILQAGNTLCAALTECFDTERNDFLKLSAIKLQCEDHEAFKAVFKDFRSAAEMRRKRLWDMVPYVVQTIQHDIDAPEAIERVPQYTKIVLQVEQLSKQIAKDLQDVLEFEAALEDQGKIKYKI
jgi:hypothetical protein